ncbi:MAG: ankyrin repeat domain-containing protein [Candidatus Babeliales bacterium]
MKKHFFFLLLISFFCFPGGKPNKSKKPKNQLFAACRANNKEYVQELLAQNSTPLAWPYTSLVHEAAATKTDDPHILNLLIEKECNPNLPLDLNGETPLHWASRFGNIKIVTALLKHNASIDALTVDKKTPLHEALLQNPSEKIVSLFLNHGASNNLLDHAHRTPLSIAIDKSEFQIVRLLLVNPPEKYKRKEELDNSKKRIKTFLALCLEKYLNIPNDIKFHILSFMPEEIYSPAMLVALLENNTSFLHVPLNKYYPLSYFVAALKKLQHPYLQEYGPKMLKDYILTCANTLCTTPYTLYGNREDNVYLQWCVDPQNDSARSYLIDEHIKNLLKTE